MHKNIMWHQTGWLKKGTIPVKYSQPVHSSGSQSFWMNFANVLFTNHKLRYLKFLGAILHFGPWLLVIGIRVFADFLKCTSGFQPAMITFPAAMWQKFICDKWPSDGVRDNVAKAHRHISYRFGGTEAKMDWGYFYPPVAGIRVKMAHSHCFQP